MITLTKPLALGSLVLVLASVVAPEARAHHSYSMFDMQKVVEVKGTVKEFRYTNPHCWIVLAVPGQDADTTLEANGPGYLAKFGWNRLSLKAGDAVTVTMNPLRDGSPGGNLLKLKFPDGRELNATPGRPPGPGGAPGGAAGPGAGAPGAGAGAPGAGPAKPAGDK